MWNFMFAKPFYLMAFFLSGQQVLLGLGIVSLVVAAYIIYKKQSYKADGERMLQKTALNKSVGFMSALALVLIVMSWTSKSQVYDLLSGNLEDENYIGIDVPPTVPPVELPPEPVLDPPKLQTPDIKITEKPEPAPDPDKKKSPEGTKEGTGKTAAGPKGPIMPPAPKLKIIPPKTETVDLEPQDFAEEMPRFADNQCEDLQGSGEELIATKKACADKALTYYLAKTVHYPAMAREANIQGIVYMRFIVELDGSISNIEMIKDNTGGGGLKQAATRAIKKMAKNKKFVPGQQNGRAVRVRMVVPINFKLK